MNLLENIRNTNILLKPEKHFHSKQKQNEDIHSTSTTRPDLRVRTGERERSGKEHRTVIFVFPGDTSAFIVLPSPIHCEVNLQTTGAKRQTRMLGTESILSLALLYISNN